MSEVLAGDERQKYGLDHERSGEVIVISQRRQLAGLLLVARRCAGSVVRATRRYPSQTRIRSGRIAFRSGDAHDTAGRVARARLPRRTGLDRTPSAAYFCHRKKAYLRRPPRPTPTCTRLCSVSSASDGRAFRGRQPACLGDLRQLRRHKVESLALTEELERILVDDAANQTLGMSTPAHLEDESRERPSAWTVPSRRRSSPATAQDRTFPQYPRRARACTCSPDTASCRPKNPPRARSAPCAPRHDRPAPDAAAVESLHTAYRESFECPGTCLPSGACESRSADHSHGQIEVFQKHDRFVARVLVQSRSRQSPSTPGSSRNSGIKPITSRDSSTFSASLALMQSHV